MALEEDTTLFLDDADFATICTLTPKGQPHPSSKSVQIAVIFEKRYVDTNKIEGIRMTVFGAATDFDDAGIGEGAQITYQDRVYKFVERDPSGSDDVLSLWVLREA